MLQSWQLVASLAIAPIFLLILKFFAGLRRTTISLVSSICFKLVFRLARTIPTLKFISSSRAVPRSAVFIGSAFGLVVEQILEFALRQIVFTGVELFKLAPIETPIVFVLRFVAAMRTAAPVRRPASLPSASSLLFSRRSFLFVRPSPRTFAF